MPERRKVKRRHKKVQPCFPAISDQGDCSTSERRHRIARRVCDVYVEDVDLPTMFLGIKKEM